MTIPIISLLMPTRGRAAMAERFFRSVADNTTNRDAVEIIAYVDDDDTGSHHLGSRDIRVDRIIGPRLAMGEYNNRCLLRARGEIIILVNDDIVIQTRGWDERVRALDREFVDKIYLGYANDLIQGSKLCTFPILSRRTCDVLVDPYPASYRGAFIDTHILDIFKRLQHAKYDRIRYLEDVVFEHMHYAVGKATADKTYIERVSYNDSPRFLMLRRRRQEAADRLMSVITGDKLAPYHDLISSEVSPRGLFGALWLYAVQFLLDTNLPFRWRFSLWSEFTRHFLATRTYMRRFRRLKVG